jgi:hypothetical protein
MSIRAQYKGYELDFASYPSPEEILWSYRELRMAVNARLARSVGPSIPIASRNEELPLSLNQEAIWLQEQLNPGSAAYHLPAAVRLTGRLDTAALELGIREVVRRHESLRTTFQTVDGRPRQVIHAAGVFSMPLEDLSNVKGTDQATTLQAKIEQEVSSPFHLESGPLLRARLLRLAPDEHIVILTVHHLVSDAWSQGILLRELAALYEAFSRGASSPLDELPLHYADFAKWQRGRINAEAFETTLAYWKEQLAGSPAVLSLPTDFPRPAKVRMEGGRHLFRVASGLTARLKDLALQQQVTLFTLLLSAFQILLAKESGQDDIVVGTPVAGRVRVELEGLIGCFINALAVRTHIEEQTRFVDLLHQVQGATRKLMAYQEFPFDKVIAALAPERNAAYTPVYQVIFDFVNTPPGEALVSNVRMSPVAANTKASKMDLLVDMWETQDELVGQIEYRTSLFKPETIAALASAFDELLDQIASHPALRIGDLKVRPMGGKQTDPDKRSVQGQLDRQRLNATRPKAVKI